MYWCVAVSIFPNFLRHMCPLSMVFRSDVRNGSASGSVTLLCLVTSVSSTEAETEGTEDFLFLSSPFLLPLSFRQLRRRENRTQCRRKQKEKFDP